MTPTGKGRLCGECEHEIYDFSALSWPQIVHTQVAHSNRLCGLYSEAQLAHWGQSPPSACGPLAAAAALAFALTSGAAAAQEVVPSPAVPHSIQLQGTVSNVSTNTGKQEPLFGATLLLWGTMIGTTTDAQGHYTLTVPATSRADTVTLVFSSIGFVTQELPLAATSTGVVEQNAQLVLAPDQGTTFYVRMPSACERVKWRLKRWFGRTN